MAVSRAVTGRRVPTLLRAASRLSGREPLDDAVAREHAAVDGKVAADHEGAHGGILLGQRVGLIGEVCLVLSSVDQDQTGVATVVTVTLV